MRDAKLLFREHVAPSTASLEVDIGAREPGVGGSMIRLSATYDLTGATAPTGDVTVTVTGSDTPGGNYVTVATYVIPADRAKLGGSILSTPVTSTAKRYLKTGWAGLTGGFLTDGIDWGIRDGTAMLDEYPY